MWIVVSHDRYFMDKVVDHLLVFNGRGRHPRFPGNYTQYRDWKDVKAAQERKKEKRLKLRKKKTAKVRLNEKRRMSFKEKREFEQLERGRLRHWKPKSNPLKRRCAAVRYP